jgi:hypothetical protein
MTAAVRGYRRTESPAAINIPTLASRNWRKGARRKTEIELWVIV